MAKKKIPGEVREFLRKIGGAGGKARAKNRTPEELSAIGKLGGRPKKQTKDSKKTQEHG